MLGMMPHPERCAEEVLGNDDGKLIFISMLEALKGNKKQLKMVGAGSGHGPTAPVPSRSPSRSSPGGSLLEFLPPAVDVGPWRVSQFQLSLLAHSRWVPTALGKVALAMTSPRFAEG